MSSVSMYMNRYDIDGEKYERYSPRRNIFILPIVECVAYIAYNYTYKFLYEKTRPIHSDRVDLSVKMLSHGYGCTHVGPERILVEESMILLLLNPVVSAGIVFELGCGAFSFERDVEFLASVRSDTPYLYVRVHPQSYRALKSIVVACNIDHPGCERVEVDYGNLYNIYSSYFEKIVSRVAGMERVVIPLRRALENSRLGVINGASNPSSIITNRVIGEFMEQMITKYNTTVIEGQFSELVPEKILRLARGDKELEQKLMEMFRRNLSFKQAPEQPEPTPGNIRGGIASLEMKQVMTTLRVPFNEGIVDPTIGFDAVSLGELISSGRRLIKNIKEGRFREASRILVGLLRYNGFKRGLILVESAGYDPMTGNVLAMMGVNTIYFTTGLGSPWGGLVPTIKVTADKHTWMRYGGEEGFIDYYIDLSRSRGGIMDDLESILVETYSGGRVRHENIGVLGRYLYGNYVIGVETYNLTLQQIYMRA